MKKLLLSFFIAMLAVPFFGNSQQTLETISGKQLFGDMKARHIGPALMSGRVCTNPLMVEQTGKKSD